MIEFRHPDYAIPAPEAPLDFSPDDTPDEVRAWLAKQRYEREQARKEASP